MYEPILNNRLDRFIPVLPLVWEVFLFCYFQSCCKSREEVGVEPRVDEVGKAGVRLYVLREAQRPLSCPKPFKNTLMK